MDARTREALEASIKHWQDNLAADSPADVSVQEGDCALCRAFIDLGCRGCPVFRKTERKFCKGSPYVDACKALKEWKSGDFGRRVFTIAAQAELDFLRSLLPSEEA
jgi:hypothetical protein